MPTSLAVSVVCSLSEDGGIEVCLGMSPSGLCLSEFEIFEPQWLVVLDSKNAKSTAPRYGNRSGNLVVAHGKPHPHPQRHPGDANYGVAVARWHTVAAVCRRRLINDGLDGIPSSSSSLDLSCADDPFLDITPNR